MKVSNSSTVKKYKRLFFGVGIVIALVALALFLFNYTIWGIAGVGLFSLWYLFFHVADYQWIEYMDENGKIVLRYYKAIKFGTPKYNAIEFPQQILQNAHFDNSLFGKYSDVTFFVRTKRGIAEYPSVSLAAVPFKDRKKMQESLSEIRRQKVPK